MKTQHIILIAGILLQGTVINAGIPPAGIKKNSLPATELIAFEKADSLFMNGDYQEALDLFQPLLKKRSDDEDLNYYTGMCLYYLEQPALAEPFLEKASLNRSLKVRILFLKQLKENNSIVL
ncbi:MAG: tetratricopeptide repeat protein [Bacteroidales bacterium]